MAELLIVLILGYVALFFVAVFYSLKFQFGENSKDERGKKILNSSYGIAFPLFILGWFIIYLIDEFYATFSFESYKLAIWFVISGAYIIHAAALFKLQRTS